MNEKKVRYANCIIGISLLRVQDWFLNESSVIV